MDLNMEKNYKIKLQNFLDILREKAIEFNESVVELNRIVSRIENLSPRLVVLENIENNRENGLKLYPMDMVEKILSLVLSEINSNINRAHEVVRQMGESIDVLYKFNRELTSAANAVRMLENSSIVRGTHNRKPLDYYIEESCNLLHAWKHLHGEIVAVWRQVNVRDAQTMEIAKRTQRTPLKCQESLDEYLLLCSMIPPNKRNK